jgi:hypothetical protein
MDNEAMYATVYAICKLMGQEKNYKEIQEAINEGIELYRHPERVPRSKA